MSEILSAIPACFVGAVILGVAIYFSRRQQKQQDEQYQSFSQESAPTVDSDVDKSAIEQEIAHFFIGEVSGKTVVQTAHKTPYGQLLQIIRYARTSQSGGEQYSAIFQELKRPSLPHFLLIKKPPLLERTVNQSLYGPDKTVSLHAFPELEQSYLCIGQNKSQISQLLDQTLGKWLTKELRNGHIYNLEVRSGKMLFYRFESGQISREQFTQLGQAAQEVTRLLSSSNI